jgi:hypothetical protein
MTRWGADPRRNTPPVSNSRPTRVLPWQSAVESQSVDRSEAPQHLARCQFAVTSEVFLRRWISSAKTALCEEIGDSAGEYGWEGVAEGWGSYLVSYRAELVRWSSSREKGGAHRCNPRGLLLPPRPGWHAGPGQQRLERTRRGWPAGPRCRHRAVGRRVAPASGWRGRPTRQRPQWSDAGEGLTGCAGEKLEWACSSFGPDTTLDFFLFILFCLFISNSIFN